ncbi:MarR family winged helix-turn-helix transcriptional regulator [Streptomyces celluloflavus]|uniref:MarR family winged helix-turn-helix transcriptional regulator n=1 Tax=Streptomyces celluloflavus TaxID=58344 RepID=UPI003687D437
MTRQTHETPPAMPVLQQVPAPQDGPGLPTGPATTTAPGRPVSRSAPARGLAQGWCALSALHGRIETHIERALQAGHDLSVREFSVLMALSEQHDGPGGHLRMHQVADSVVLSQSATTRLVTRLEERGLLARYLCSDDRRGIYTNVTPDGLALLAQARPTHDSALREALQNAAKIPELAPLVTAVETLVPSA